MGIIIIPLNYEQLPESERNTIVPICIASVDRYGNLIAPVWFEKGVAPVQNQLRHIARIKLGDVYRVSELSEITVHKLWERHGAEAGAFPWRRVLVRAIWEARDLAAGDAQWHINHTVALSSLERGISGNGLRDPATYDQIFERELLVDKIERCIREDGRPEILRAFQMLRQGYSWAEVATTLGEPNPEALKKRFWRWMRLNFSKRH